MKFVILATGTRGDVQPFVALAQGLAGAGHEAVLAAPGSFEPFARGHGVSFHPMGSDYAALLESPEGKAALGGNPVKMVQVLRQTVFPMMRRMLDDAWEAAQGAGAVIYHPKALAGVHLAERLGVPCFIGAPVPVVVPTAAFPAPAFVGRSLGGPLNRLTYYAVRSGSRPFRGMIDEWRRTRLGLGPRREGEYTHRGRPVPVLHAFSRHVVPPPADWPPEAIVTGYWFPRPAREWAPPPALTAFLEAGPPPVYVGFGSMSGIDREGINRMVVAALARAGMRGVLATGTGEAPAPLSDTVLAIPGAPHDWLFPRMAAVVHHGGAGTTAAGLAAGRPTVICPATTDQPFWGHIVHRLGVGPAPIPRRQLTAERLAEAVRAATGDPEMQRRAAALGEAIRAEDGVAQAVAEILRRVGALAG
ncbi:sterol 3beta-glucosyltransferase [Symbiobacterium terraclitae]|uniref:Sterol 3beta-glucosyltransferase n=1 Tax=Symbiobacterium terraclitae TaxID=557451 RepID=A0ABS4JRX1_9FIRM|nr:glycosyltransferase [Symbiobacterium terraclitae]MBP2018281.1 sterol 3beta-glucosyltransferase [Symbiobacterium terraclitae]